MEGDRGNYGGIIMGRQEIIDHIETELHQDTDANCNADQEARPTLCQHCGAHIASEPNATASEQGDYVVHRVPSHGAEKMNSVFYCGPSCFTEAMSTLFSPADE